MNAPRQAEAPEIVRLTAPPCPPETVPFVHPLPPALPAARVTPSSSSVPLLSSPVAVAFGLAVRFGVRREPLPR